MLPAEALAIPVDIHEAQAARACVELVAGRKVRPAVVVPEAEGAAVAPAAPG